MRLETIPLIVGALVVLGGLAIIVDAVIPDGTFVPRERRRRARPERVPGGELATGLGIALVGVSLIGRDSWRYTSVSMFLAVAMLAVGLVLNRRYLRGLLFGPSFGRTMRRRATDAAPATDATPAAGASADAPADAAPRAPEGASASSAARPADRLRIR